MLKRFTSTAVLLAMLLTDTAAFAMNFCILYFRTGFSPKPLRRFGVPVLCGATLFLWTRIFFRLFQDLCQTDAGALAFTSLGAVLLYVLVLRLMGIRLLRYLSRRLERPQLPHLCMW